MQTAGSTPQALFLELLHLVDKALAFLANQIALGHTYFVKIDQTGIAAVHADGALAGIHCCGNTEWSILIDAGVDIVNFDAFGFGETIAMYADKVKTHLANGGLLAWGVVPTSTVIREQTVESLEAQLEKVMDHLAATGIDKGLITRQAIITPSCGTGSMAVEDAEKVFDMVSQLSKRMKAKYGF